MAKDEKNKRKLPPAFASGMRGAEPAPPPEPDDDDTETPAPTPAPAARPNDTPRGRGKGKAKARDVFSSGMRGAEKPPVEG